MAMATAKRMFIAIINQHVIWSFWKGNPIKEAKF